MSILEKLKLKIDEDNNIEEEGAKGLVEGFGKLFRLK